MKIFTNPKMDIYELSSVDIVTASPIIDPREEEPVTPIYPAD